MQDDDDAWLGKGTKTFRAWWRTFLLLVTDRRALLSTAPARDDGPMPPLAFLLATVAAATLVNSMVGVNAPGAEQPAFVQAMLTASSSFWDPKVLYFVVMAALTALIYWAAFRATLVRIGFRVALRHSAYNLAGIIASSVLLNLIGGLIRLAGGTVSSTLNWVGATANAVVYWWLLGIAFRQAADECGIRVRRAVLPFAVAWVVLVLTLVIALDSGPEVWLRNVPQMQPAIRPDDAVRVSRWAVRSKARELQPGEVVLVRRRDAPPQRIPLGGIADEQAHPLLMRVLAVPEDSVAMSGPDITVDGDTVPRTAIHSPSQPHTTGMTPFHERIGEKNFVAEFGPKAQPRSCLSNQPTTLASGQYLLATDSRPDDMVFCVVVDRDRIVGVADWDGRTEAKP